METRRICPKCRKQYPGHEVICEECGERLAEISSDCQASFSMVREPVLLSNGHDIDVMYLKEELKKQNVPYYVEEGQIAVPSNHIKEGILEIVSYTNFYVDKSTWKAAKEALGGAREERRKGLKASGAHYDSPGEAGSGPGAGGPKAKGQEAKRQKAEGLEAEDQEAEGREGQDERQPARSLWARFMDQEVYIRLGMVVVVAVFLMGVVKIILS